MELIKQVFDPNIMVITRIWGSEFRLPAYIELVFRYEQV